jgi:hypothetical protein
VHKPGASGLRRNSARRDLLWRGYGLGDGPSGLEEPRRRGATRTASGLSMPRTACPVRLRMLFTGENATVDGRFRAASEATTILPNGAGSIRTVASADTRGAKGVAAGDAAIVVTGASTIATAGVDTDAAAGVKGAVLGVSTARDAGAVTGCPCSVAIEAACVRDSTRRALLAARVSTSPRATFTS